MGLEGTDEKIIVVFKQGRVTTVHVLSARKS